MSKRFKTAFAGVALAAGIATAGATASPSSVAAACGSPDGVSVANRWGVTATGTVYWPTSQYSVDLRVTVRDPRDGRAGRAYVQFMQEGQGYWKDRLAYAIPDGGAITLPARYTGGYRIQKVGIGVGSVGDSNYQIAWDSNDRCGA